MTSLKAVLSSIALCVAASGCGVGRELTRNGVDQIRYHDTLNDLAQRARNRHLAKEALDDYEDDLTDLGFSKHFERGFREGFAKYLEGGSGQPPAMPPREYWKVHYQTAQGYAAIQEWFEGYRVGALSAEQSGYRQWWKIPSSFEAPVEFTDGLMLLDFEGPVTESNRSTEGAEYVPQGVADSAVTQSTPGSPSKSSPTREREDWTSRLPGE